MMGVSFSKLVYEPNFDMWAVPITVRPLISQPGAPDYDARGIFNTEETDVVSLDGGLISDQKTILDILESEFARLPVQGDHVIIPLDCNGKPQGEFEIIDGSTNGGGETTLTLRRWKA
jgi:hypothetical protein